ncbi:MAG: hypothetical protein OEM52_13165 [bacterium]|nr:hypothetical protein [bacterium]
MKFSLLRFIFVTLFLVGFFDFADASSNFGKAKELLVKKQPVAAIRLLHPAISSNQATPGEWQLAAIAYWNAYGGDSLAYALRTATIAHRLSPNSETRQLLNWLRQKVSNRIDGIPKIALFRILNTTFLQVPALLL